MPLQDWNLKSTFDGAYEFNAERDGHPNTRPGVKLNYHRGPKVGIADRIASYFDNYLGPAAYNQRFVIIGGGFGWVAGALLDRGFTNVVVVETSTYILTEMDNDDEQEVRDACSTVGLDPNGTRANELVSRWARPGIPRRRRTAVASDVPVVNEDISTGPGRTAVRNALTPSGNPQIVVTEDVMTCLSDAEVIALASDCQAWGGQQSVAHLVTTLTSAGDPDFNWKTLAEWQLLIPGDIWIDATTGEVLE